MPDTIPPPAGDDADEELEVDFETWALASAKLLRRSVIERAESLRESGIVPSWKEVDERWYEALVQDIDSGQLTRLNRYMQICADEMQRRADEEDEVKSPLDAIGGPLGAPATLPGSDEPPASSQPGSASSPLGSPGPSGQPLASVTPPLGSSDSIEIDLTEIDPPGIDHDVDDEDSSPDDTRVSAAIPEVVKSD